MTYKYSIPIILLIMLFSCVEANKKMETNNQENFRVLNDRLSEMVYLDQHYSYPPNIKNERTIEQWRKKKDSVYSAHCLELKKYFNKYGYLGYDKVGKIGEREFWLMVQHCKDVQFQQRVLKALKIEVLNYNASPRHIGLLTDRFLINQGKKQIYGTQLRYRNNGQAYPKPLMDSIEVDVRRDEVCLEPLFEYLNSATKHHYDLNKENLLKKGIKSPVLYEKINHTY